MNIEKRAATFLLNLVQKRPPSKAGGEMARHLAEVHSIGVVSGTRVMYTGADFLRAANLLRLNKIDPDTAPDAWKAVGRTDSGMLRGNEKWAGNCGLGWFGGGDMLTRASLRVSNTSLLLPAKSHLVLPVEDVAGNCQHSTLIVVENFEPFHRCGLWDMRYLSRCGTSPLFVFRGEKEGTRADAVNALLRLSALPVFAAFDLDPAGMGTALSLPRLDGLIAPSPAELDRHLRIDRESSSGRSALYLKQYPHWARLLDASPHPEVQPLWEVIRRHGEGVVQEAFLERANLDARAAAQTQASTQDARCQSSK